MAASAAALAAAVVSAMPLWQHDFVNTVLPAVLMLLTDCASSRQHHAHAYSTHYIL